MYGAQSAAYYERVAKIVILPVPACATGERRCFLFSPMRAFETELFNDIVRKINKCCYAGNQKRIPILKSKYYRHSKLLFEKGGIDNRKGDFIRLEIREIGVLENRVA